jgi:hypothetical protein
MGIRCPRSWIRTICPDQCVEYGILVLLHTGENKPKTPTSRFVYHTPENVRKNTPFSPLDSMLSWKSRASFIYSGRLSRANLNLYRGTCAKIRAGVLKREYSND